MTKNKIMALANKSAGQHWMDEAHIHRFAALVAVAERKACAKVCEEIEENCWETWDSLADSQDQGSAIGAAHCAAAIRARGEK